MRLKMISESDQSPFRGNIAYLAAFSVALITFLVYLPALQHGYVNLDDSNYVYDNINIRSLDFGLLKWSITAKPLGLWHPLSFLTFALDYFAFGLDPIGYHLTNIVLHTLNTYLVFIIATRLCRYVNRPYKQTIVAAFITAFLFGVHPLHVESVAWVSERKDVLCSFFFLLSLIAYIKYISKAQKKFNYLLATSFFILAVMSKPMAISLPVVLLIIDYYPLQRLTFGGNTGKVLIEKLPFFIIGLLPVIITLWSKTTVNLPNAMGNPFIERLLVFIEGYFFYIYKMILPVNLAPMYIYPTKINMFDLEYIGPLVLLFLISSFCFSYRKKWTVLYSVWLYYIFTLIPVFGVLGNAPQSMADRYSYLPSLGPFLLIGLTVVTLYERTITKYRLVVMALLLLSSSLLLNNTIRKISAWQDTVALWSSEIKVYPNSAFSAYNDRGDAYILSNNYIQALKDFNKSIEINPLYMNAYNNRANVYTKLGNYSSAIKDFDKCIEFNPGDFISYYNRGSLYLTLAQYPQAISDYNTAIELNPNYEYAYLNLGIANYNLGNYSQSIKYFSKAIEINPNGGNIYFNRGTVYMKLGYYTKAIEDFNKTIGINPGHAMAIMNLGTAQGGLGNYSEALIYLNKSIELNPKFASAYNNRGMIYFKMGNYQQAMMDFNKAIELAPDYAEAYSNLGLAYKESGDLKAALTYENKAAELIKMGNK